MSQLPPFAQALKARQNARQSQQKIPTQARPTPRDFDDDLYSEPPQRPLPANPPPPFDDRYIDELPKPKIKQNNFNEEQLLSEIDELHGIIHDLQEKNSELEAENARLLANQQKREVEKQISSDYERQIEELKISLHEEQNNNQCLSDKIQQLETILNGKQQFAAAKEEMVQRYETEYKQVNDAYQKTLETLSRQTAQLRLAQERIAELEAEVTAGSARNPPRSNFDQPLFNDNLSRNDFDRFDPPPADNFDPYQPESHHFTPDPLPADLAYDDFQPPRDIPPVSPPRAPVRDFPMPVRRAALEDNISFGVGNEYTPPPINPDMMSIDEMKILLEQLKKEKEELEKDLSKAPPKGGKMIHYKVEREEKEERLDQLGKDISKIRLTLKRQGAL